MVYLILIAMGQINTKYEMLALHGERWPFSYSEMQMCTEYEWASWAERDFYGNAYAEHTAEKHQQPELPQTGSLGRPPLVLASALFFCSPGENICELFEWNLILETV